MVALVGLLGGVLVPLAQAGCAKKPAAPEAPAARADRLVLDTDKHELALYAGDEHLHTFRVGLGSAEPGKTHRGDHATPIGTYRLMAGRNSSNFYRFLPVSYPNERDAQRGLREGLITQAQYDAIVSATRRGVLPPQNTALGGAIGVHGYGQKLSGIPKKMQVFHRFIDATQGCILLSDAEIDELETMYEPGAVLEIR